MILTSACTPQPPVAQSIAPQPSPSPNPPTVEIIPVASPQPLVISNDAEVYQDAITKADAANAIGQSATSKDDWLLVAHNLEDSVQMLKSITKVPTSSQYVVATKILPKYEEKLATARNKAASFVSKSPLNVAPSSQVATTTKNNTFSIPIQQKLGGIPVIEVTFNGRPVPMLLDTGASHTLVTPSIARQLQLQASGNSQAKTANGTATFQVATIDQIKFGAGERNNVLVAIGQNDLPYGLLGHDVYDGYDITLKENSIEFRQR